MKFYAHSTEDRNWQLLKTHLQETARIAEIIASKFNSNQLAYLTGLLHDAGKYSVEFQKRLKGEGGMVDHSTAGAVIANNRYGALGLIMAYAISGHHCGLPDGGSEVDDAALASRLNKHLCDYNAFFTEMELPPAKNISFPNLTPVNGQGISVHFFIRFLFSCLVDADFLDTEKAMDWQRSVYREKQYSIYDLMITLDNYVDHITENSPNTYINRKRAEILASCREKSQRPTGLYTLTVPTGGGKTFSSLSFALRHAYCYGKDRVIYVIPYTSIIEQNAAEFKNAIGEENVLEHHSNFTFPEEVRTEADGEFTSEIGEKLKLAAENWDMPVIVTTNVQFFESLYASRNSKCRKLHNITNSVIIVDEAQMLPTGFLKPCLQALVELAENYNSTVVFCTATQPALQKLLPEGITPEEIIKEPKELYQEFKRVHVCYTGSVTDEVLSERLNDYNQVLCIVNSKKHARELFELISKQGRFHLSTRMCAAHRTKILAEIKAKLKEELTCRVISTQLIEAGVDIDFPAVYRSMAGIDSIAQSAGRCNREGKQHYGQVNVFWPENHGLPKGWLNRTAALGREIIENSSDPLAPEEVEKYFSLLYDLEDEKLDKNGIISKIKEQESILRFPFREIEEEFKLIEDFTNSIIIPWDETCRNILRETEQSIAPGAYARKLQRYGVQIFEKEFKELLRYGAVYIVGNRYYVLKDEFYKKYYDNELGLKPFTESMFINDDFII